MKALSVKRKYLVTGIFSLLFLLLYFIILPYFDVSDLKNHIYSLDIRSSYSLEYVRQLFDTIGSEGLQQYLYFLIADFVYIAVYGVLAYFLLSLLIAQMGKLGQMLRLTVYTPALIMLADIIENINTFWLIFNANDFGNSFVRYASAITTIKWYIASVIVAMILCYGFYALLRFVFWKLRNIKN